MAMMSERIRPAMADIGIRLRSGDPSDRTRMAALARVQSSPAAGERKNPAPGTDARLSEREQDRGEAPRV